MLVIKNAAILSMAGVQPFQGDILIDDHRIVKTGPDITVPLGADIMNADGLVALPGFIDAHTHTGLFAQGMQNANETSSMINAELDIFHSLSPGADFKHALSEGVTTVSVLPGASTVFGGLGCIVKTCGETTDDMLVVRKSCMKGSLSFSVSRHFGPAGTGPSTIMGHVQVMRDWLARARDYASDIKAPNSRPRQIALENLALVIEKKIPLRVHCESYNILNVIKIAEEFDIPFTLEHAFGASAFIEEIAAAKGLQGVVFGPLYYTQMPGISKEVKNRAALALMERNIPVSIMSDFFPSVNFATLLYQAGELVRSGCSVYNALRTLTINAAKILGIDHRVGTLEPGKDADITLFSAVPLADASAKVVKVIVNGRLAYHNENGH